MTIASLFILLLLSSAVLGQTSSSRPDATVSTFVCRSDLSCIEGNYRFLSTETRRGGRIVCNIVPRYIFNGRTLVDGQAKASDFVVTVTPAASVVTGPGPIAISAAPDFEFSIYVSDTADPTSITLNVQISANLLHIVQSPKVFTVLPIATPRLTSDYSYELTCLRDQTGSGFLPVGSLPLFGQPSASLAGVLELRQGHNTSCKLTIVTPGRLPILQEDILINVYDRWPVPRSLAPIDAVVRLTPSEKSVITIDFVVTDSRTSWPPTGQLSAYIRIAVGKAYGPSTCIPADPNLVTFVPIVDPLHLRYVDVHAPDGTSIVQCTSDLMEEDWWRASSVTVPILSAPHGYALCKVIPMRAGFRVKALRSDFVLVPTATVTGAVLSESWWEAATSVADVYYFNVTNNGAGFPTSSTSPIDAFLTVTMPRWVTLPYAPSSSPVVIASPVSPAPSSPIFLAPTPLYPSYPGIPPSVVPNIPSGITTPVQGLIARFLNTQYVIPSVGATTLNCTTPLGLCGLGSGCLCVRSIEPIECVITTENPSVPEDFVVLVRGSGALSQLFTSSLQRMPGHSCGLCSVKPDSCCPLISPIRTDPWSDGKRHTFNVIAAKTFFVEFGQIALQVGGSPSADVSQMLPNTLLSMGNPTCLRVVALGIPSEKSSFTCIYSNGTAAGGIVNATGLPIILRAGQSATCTLHCVDLGGAIQNCTVSAFTFDQTMSNPAIFDVSFPFGPLSNVFVLKGRHLQQRPQVVSLVSGLKVTPLPSSAAYPPQGFLVGSPVPLYLYADWPVPTERSEISCGPVLPTSVMRGDVVMCDIVPIAADGGTISSWPVDFNVSISPSSIVVHQPWISLDQRARLAFNFTAYFAGYLNGTTNLPGTIEVHAVSVETGLALQGSPQVLSVLPGSRPTVSNTYLTCFGGLTPFGFPLSAVRMDGNISCDVWFTAPHSPVWPSDVRIRVIPQDVLYLIRPPFTTNAPSTGFGFTVYNVPESPGLKISIELSVRTRSGWVIADTFVAYVEDIGVPDSRQSFISCGPLLVRTNTEAPIRCTLDVRSFHGRRVPALIDDIDFARFAPVASNSLYPPFSSDHFSWYTQTRVNTTRIDAYFTDISREPDYIIRDINNQFVIINQQSSWISWARGNTGALACSSDLWGNTTTSVRRNGVIFCTVSSTVPGVRLGTEISLLASVLGLPGAPAASSFHPISRPAELYTYGTFFNFSIAMQEGSVQASPHDDVYFCLSPNAANPLAHFPPAPPILIEPFDIPDTRSTIVQCGSLGMALHIPSASTSPISVYPAMAPVANINSTITGAPASVMTPSGALPPTVQTFRTNETIFLRRGGWITCVIHPRTILNLDAVVKPSDFSIQSAASSPPFVMADAAGGYGQPVTLQIKSTGAVFTPTVVRVHSVSPRANHRTLYSILNIIDSDFPAPHHLTSTVSCSRGILRASRPVICTISSRDVHGFAVAVPTAAFRVSTGVAVRPGSGAVPTAIPEGVGYTTLEFTVHCCVETVNVTLSDFIVSTMKFRAISSEAPSNETSLECPHRIPVGAPFFCLLQARVTGSAVLAAVEDFALDVAVSDEGVAFGANIYQYIHWTPLQLQNLSYAPSLNLVPYVHPSTVPFTLQNAPIPFTPWTGAVSPTLAAPGVVPPASPGSIASSQDMAYSFSIFFDVPAMISAGALLTSVGILAVYVEPSAAARQYNHPEVVNVVGNITGVYLGFQGSSPTKCDLQRTRVACVVPATSSDTALLEFTVNGFGLSADDVFVFVAVPMPPVDSSGVLPGDIDCSNATGRVGYISYSSDVQLNPGAQMDAFGATSLKLKGRVPTSGLYAICYVGGGRVRAFTRRLLGPIINGTAIAILNATTTINPFAEIVVHAGGPVQSAGLLGLRMSEVSITVHASALDATHDQMWLAPVPPDSPYYLGSVTITNSSGNSLPPASGNTDPALSALCGTGPGNAASFSERLWGTSGRSITFPQGIPAFLNHSAVLPYAPASHPWPVPVPMPVVVPVPVQITPTPTSVNQSGTMNASAPLIIPYAVPTIAVSSPATFVPMAVPPSVVAAMPLIAFSISMFGSTAVRWDFVDPYPLGAVVTCYRFGLRHEIVALQPVFMVYPKVAGTQVVQYNHDEGTITLRISGFGIGTGQSRGTVVGNASFCELPPSTYVATATVETEESVIVVFPYKLLSRVPRPYALCYQHQTGPLQRPGTFDAAAVVRDVDVIVTATNDVVSRRPLVYVALRGITLSESDAAVLLPVAASACSGTQTPSGPFGGLVKATMAPLSVAAGTPLLSTVEFRFTAFPSWFYSLNVSLCYRSNGLWGRYWENSSIPSSSTISSVSQQLDTISIASPAFGDASAVSVTGNLTQSLRGIPVNFLFSGNGLSATSDCFKVQQASRTARLVPATDLVTATWAFSSRQSECNDDSATLYQACGFLSNHARYQVHIPDFTVASICYRPYLAGIFVSVGGLVGSPGLIDSSISTIPGVNEQHSASSGLRIIFRGTNLNTMPYGDVAKLVVRYSGQSAFSACNPPASQGSSDGVPSSWSIIDQSPIAVTDDLGVSSDLPSTHSAEWAITTFFRSGPAALCYLPAGARSWTVVASDFYIVPDVNVAVNATPSFSVPVGTAVTLTIVGAGLAIDDVVFLVPASMGCRRYEQSLPGAVVATSVKLHPAGGLRAVVTPLLRGTYSICYSPRYPITYGSSAGYVTLHPPNGFLEVFAEVPSSYDLYLNAQGVPLTYGEPITAGSEFSIVFRGNLLDPRLGAGTASIVSLPSGLVTSLLASAPIAVPFSAQFPAVVSASSPAAMFSPCEQVSSDRLIVSASTLIGDAPSTAMSWNLANGISAAGVYAVCYDPSMSTQSFAIMPYLVVLGRVLAAASQPPVSQFGTSATITFTGLGLTAGVDKISLVPVSAACGSIPGVSATTIPTVSSLADGKTQTVANVLIDFPSGLYRICYYVVSDPLLAVVLPRQRSNFTITSVGNLVATGVVDVASHGGPGNLLSGDSMTLTFTGRGLRTTPLGDAVALIKCCDCSVLSNLSSDQFRSTVGGILLDSLPVVFHDNLGPGNEPMTSTTTAFIHSGSLVSGDYAVCYQPYMGSWTRVGNRISVAASIASVQALTGSPVVGVPVTLRLSGSGITFNSVVALCHNPNSASTGARNLRLASSEGVVSNSQIATITPSAAGSLSLCARNVNSTWFVTSAKLYVGVVASSWGGADAVPVGEIATINIAAPGVDVSRDAVALVSINYGCGSLRAHSPSGGIVPTVPAGPHVHEDFLLSSEVGSLSLSGSGQQITWKVPTRSLSAGTYDVCIAVPQPSNTLPSADYFPFTKVVSDTLDIVRWVDTDFLLYDGRAPLTGEPFTLVIRGGLLDVAADIITLVSLPSSTVPFVPVATPSIAGPSTDACGSAWKSSPTMGSLAAFNQTALGTADAKTRFEPIVDSVNINRPTPANTWVTASFTAQSESALYGICYSVGGAWTLMNHPVRITGRVFGSWTGSVNANGLGAIVFTGASLRTTPGGDAVKAVIEGSPCTAPAMGGAGEETDLGPADSLSTSTSIWNPVFFHTGSSRYTICYRAAFNTYVAVPPTLVVPQLPVSLDSSNQGSTSSDPISISWTTSNGNPPSDSIGLIASAVDLQSADSRNRISVHETLSPGRSLVTFHSFPGDPSHLDAQSLAARLVQICSDVPVLRCNNASAIAPATFPAAVMRPENGSSTSGIVGIAAGVVSVLLCIFGGAVMFFALFRRKQYPFHTAQEHKFFSQIDSVFSGGINGLGSKTLPDDALELEEDTSPYPSVAYPSMGVRGFPPPPYLTQSSWLTRESGNSSQSRSRSPDPTEVPPAPPAPPAGASKVTQNSNAAITAAPVTPLPVPAPNQEFGSARLQPSNFGNPSGGFSSNPYMQSSSS